MLVETPTFFYLAGLVLFILGPFLGALLLRLSGQVSESADSERRRALVFAAAVTILFMGLGASLIRLGAGFPLAPW
jgi:hypothetical protein